MSLSKLSDEGHEVFGPGTDLTLSLVAILMMLLFVTAHELAATKLQEHQSQIELEAVQRHQLELVQALAAAFEGHAHETAPGRFEIITARAGEATLLVENEATLQRISFGSHLLFNSDEHELLDSGREVLRKFVKTLRSHLQELREVQIQGHADPVTTYKYASNLDLAAQRALEVFKLLRTEGNLDPARQLMSVTSFGEFFPVARRELTSFDPELLAIHNTSEAERRRNRRIEIVLIYRPGSAAAR